MPYPTKYTRQYDFQGYQVSNPTRPLPGNQVNTDLNAVKQSVGEIIDFLKNFSRADGQLANGSVGVTQLNPNLNLGFSLPTVWEPRVEYTTDSTVLYANKFWKSKVAHTSSDGFDESKWDEIVDFGAQADAAAASAAAALVSQNAAAESAGDTAADRVQTGLDAAATAADRVQTGQDAVATAADRVQTGSDAAATAADRVQTGLDAASAALSAGTVASATVNVAASYDTVSAAEGATIGANRKAIFVQGRSVVDAIGRYLRASSEPSHLGKFRSDDRFLPDGTTDSVNGGWWRLDEPTLNSAMFGPAADGDGNGGGTNDAVALQAALDVAAALGTRPLRILPGVYRCDAGLTVPAHLEVIAYGATIDFKSAGDITGVQFVNGGKLSGATLLGAGNAAMSSDGVAIQCIGTNNTPAAPTFVAAPIVRDCAVDGWAGYGVLFKYVTGGLVTNNVIKDIGYAAFMGLSANDTLVDGNLIDSVTPGTGDAYGIAFTRQTGDTETVDPRSYRCKAINNTIRNVFSVAGDNAQGLNTHAGVDLVFEGNTVDHCEVGCIVAGAVLGGIPKLAPQRCIVRGNVFVSTDTPSGVGTMVSGAINGSSIEEFAEGCIVSGNTYRGFGIPGNGTSAAVIVQGTKGVVVSGNTLRTPRCNGIRAGYGNLGFNISGNSITNPRDNTHTVPACVYVSDNTNRGYIGENTFVFEDDSSATYIAIQSIRIEVSLTGLDIELGRGSFVGIDNTHLSYVEGTSTGVNAAGLMVQRGRATVSLPATGAGVQAVSLKRFPATPRIVLQRIGTPVPGAVAKPPILEADGISVTGFSIIARAYDLTAFGGTGDLPVDWIATL